MKIDSKNTFSSRQKLQNINSGSLPTWDPSQFEPYEFNDKDYKGVHEMHCKDEDNRTHM